MQNHDVMLCDANNLKRTSTGADQSDTLTVATSFEASPSESNAWIDILDDDGEASDETLWAGISQRIHLFRSQSLGQSIILIVLFGCFAMQLNSRACDYPNRHSSYSLGSAAISSVTNTLYPIMPFAGGLDLRKKDYWMTGGNWWDSLVGVALQVQEAFASTESSKVSSFNNTFLKPPTQTMVKNSNRYATIISAPTLFIDAAVIGDLTLGEMAETFRFAIDSSRKGFSSSQFLGSVPPRVKPVIEAIQRAVSLSRGKHVRDTEVSIQKSTKRVAGNVDALKFAAALRIFAEWRILRQVPDGYKGYAVGMSLGHKDIVQNVAKIEHAVHQYLDTRESTYHSDLVTPTLYELLHNEAKTGLHPALPRLKEKSAAMGLLWVRRQMYYQTCLFENVLLVPSKFASGRDAIAAAYKQVYDPYHGWAVQKIFNYSFQAAPKPETIYRHMNPHRLAEVMRITRSSHFIAPSGVDEDPDSHQDDNRNPVLLLLNHIGGEWNKLTNHVGGEWNKFSNHVGGEWDKFARNIGNFVARVESNNLGTTLEYNSKDSSNNLSEEMEEFITGEMIKDAQGQITTYLGIVNPLLTDLKELFDMMNMNDPTRV